MRASQKPEITSHLAETQLQPYQSTNVQLKRDLAFEKSQIDTKKENKPLIRQKILV